MPRSTRKPARAAARLRRTELVPEGWIDLSHVEADHSPHEPDAEEIAEVLAAIAQHEAEVEQLSDEEIEQEWTERQLRSPWDAGDVAFALQGGLPGEPEPTVLVRSDGQPLLYRGKVSGIMGEPESGKGWFACLATAQTIHSLESVVYIDFEDNMVPLLRRMLGLGVREDLLSRFLWAINPTVPLDINGQTGKDFKRVLRAAQPALVILDGVTQALANEGKDSLDNKEVVQWFNELPRMIAKGPSAPAVLIIDHVVKIRADRGRGPLGAGQKLAAIDGTQFGAEVINPFDEEHAGKVKIVVTKDRPGKVRKHAVGKEVIQEIAVMSIVPDGDHTRITLWPPSDDKLAKTPDEQVIPTRIMDRMMKWLTSPGQPPTNRSQLRALVRGDNNAKTIAINQLIKDGILIERKENFDTGPVKLYVNPHYKPIKLVEDE